MFDNSLKKVNKKKNKLFNLNNITVIAEGAQGYEGNRTLAKLLVRSASLANANLIKFQLIADKIKNTCRESLISKTAKVLFENKMKGDHKYFGRDEYFNSVIVESNDDLTGKIMNVRISKFKRPR